jgi:hypothetical protein
MSDDLLFDDLDEAEPVPEHLKFANCLIIPERALTSEMLNIWEQEYRFADDLPGVTFDEGDADDEQVAGRLQ